MPFFEKEEKLDPKHLDLERARKSLREELEAIDFYQERIDATKDESLKKILTHNMNEEKEHVAMLMEWLRKNDSVQDKMFEEHD
ncbi:MAG: ferritin [candidate division WOR-3 bacterium]